MPEHDTPNQDEHTRPNEATPPDATGGSSPTPSLLRRLLDRGAQPYCDVAGIPRLRRAMDNTPFLPWPIRSRHVEAWAANLYYCQTGQLVTRSELQQALLVLEGIALENPEADREIEDAIEEEPLLTMLMVLLTDRNTWEGTASQLLSELTQLAWGHGVNPDRHPAWPVDAARLSSRLRQLTDWLAKAGIVYTYERSAHQRKHSFKRSNDASSS